MDELTPEQYPYNASTSEPSANRLSIGLVRKALGILSSKMGTERNTCISLLTASIT